jgi:N utilization substance protein A
MNSEFIQAIHQICAEKGIEKDVLLDAINIALVSAYKKHFGTNQNVEVIIDEQDGTVKVYALKTLVEEVTDENTEIAIADVQKDDIDAELGDVLQFEVTPKNFGRIAAQNAKQVVVQRIREAERVIIYDKYMNRQDEIISAIVQRVDRGKVFVSLENTEAILMPKEQVRRDKYNVNDRITVYITEVRDSPKGPQIAVSRTHPGLVKRLFEREVPEIIQGDVIIKSIAREAGSRTKIAVYAEDTSIDPVGSCVGRRGIRVNKIVDELKGEKIDIIHWSDDSVEFIGSSLSPAKIISVQIDSTEQFARVVVPDDQLSLAIGKEGQNARLAAKLTGWKIDIKSQSQVEEMESLVFHSDEEDEGDDVL